MKIKLTWKDVRRDQGIDEIYEFQKVTKLETAKKKAQEMIDEYNKEEIRRYGDKAYVRTLVSVVEVYD